MTEASEQRAPGGSTSRSLLSEARLADAAAWERLVTLYAPLVASWCRRWGVLQQDIVDVLQEVFSAVAAHLHRFRKDRPGDPPGQDPSRPGPGGRAGDVGGHGAAPSPWSRR